jgi:aspartyl-tRNA(Asn)/glutamyl-tRNA(Gln) amidotransferase subunit A
MSDRDLMFTPGHRLRQMIADKKISSVELTQASLRRIKELDPKLHAFITLDEEGALKQAKAADKAVAAGEKLGPFHGVPISIKDLEVTKGLKTTLGSDIFKDWVPDYDSVVVERVRKTGAVILGKTNTPEFGNREETFTKFFPSANNPWDPSRMPGGSSGGAAASVASGMCPIATGTDGGGSVRLPAGFCGIFGHKPTQGRWPRYGGQSKPGLNVTSTSGPMTNDVRDAAIMTQALSGFDRRDPGSLRTPVPDHMRGFDDGVKGMRIAVTTSFGYALVNDDVAEAVEDSAKAFEKLGAKVVDSDIKFDPVPREFWWDIWTAGQVAMYGHLAEERPGDLMDYTLSMIEHGRTVTGGRMSAALRQAQSLRLQLAELFEDFDLIIAPTSAAVAWPHRQPPKQIGSGMNEGDYAGLSYGAIPFTMAFNISWNPAASIPCGFGEGGMPVGLQVIADIDRDDVLFRACRAFERERPWTVKRPKVS